ncbi:endonuclease/exonuclease/phosphatase family protein [Niabella terrae]
MQFNIWQEGTKVPGGFTGIVDEIAAYRPDFVSLIEIRNYNHIDFLQRLTDSLQNRGLKYYFKSSQGSGLISRHPILAFYQGDSLPSLHKIIVEPEGVRLAVYSAHLDYTHYAQYLPRGYDGSGKKLPSPITAATALLAEDAKSTRPAAIAGFLQDAAAEKARGGLILLAGDFNEASHLDWTERTSHLFDHNGAVVNWPSSRSLYAHGFKDSFRERWPDEVLYPGFTWVVRQPWINEADERDRIDFIYYFDDGRIRPVASWLIGPGLSWIAGRQEADPDAANIRLPQSVWPSDHRALLTRFRISRK